ncbi:MAG: hypothetical protein GX465_16815 [Acidobacteria bacterium]|nr:hypothetical protein [Acidobacteriota bacterium]
MKIRFAYRGMITVEDLWDLSVQELDRIFQKLNKALKESKEESLLSPQAKEDSELAIAVAIVRHIVEVKLAEAAVALAAVERRAKKEKILSILADKQDDSLRNMSQEDLTKMLEDL